MALDMLRDPEQRRKFEQGIALEESRSWSADKRSAAISSIFGG